MVENHQALSPIPKIIPMRPWQTITFGPPLLWIQPAIGFKREPSPALDDMRTSFTHQFCSSKQRRVLKVCGAREGSFFMMKFQVGVQNIFLFHGSATSSQKEGVNVCNKLCR